ncbi:xanthine dehydrogenase accessory protein XdhC [Halovulum sp. GXIMD14793]
MVGGLDLSDLHRRVTAHGVVARAVITGFQGSSPRETGAAMLVWADGQSGTIGGGALEFAVTQEARQALAAPGARRLSRHALGPALGQCCGGAVECLIEVFNAEALAAIPDTGVYARAIGTRIGQDGPPPPKVARALSMSPEIATIDDWFIEPVARAQAPVWIYGAGHVGRALVHVLQGPPVAVTWIDTDKARFPDPLPSGPDMLVAADPASVVRHAPDDAHHLVMTYSHALDLEICHQVLSRPFATLGLIGSATKKARFESRLRALGHGAALKRLICPIGDPALGKLPSAIALSTAVALLSHLNNAENRQKQGWVT